MAEENEQVQEGQESLEPTLSDIPLEGQSQEPQAEEPVSQPNQTDFDAQQWALNYKGQQLFPKDRDHLINLAQKGHSFEQNQEALNKERKDIEALQNQYAPYKEMDETLRANPQMYNELLALQQKYSQQGQPQQQDPNFQYNEKINTMEATLKQMQQESADRQVDEALKNLQTQYPHENWNMDDGTGTLGDKVIRTALDKGITDLSDAYKILQFSQNALRGEQQASKQLAEKTKANHRAGYVQNGVPASNSKAPRQINVSDVSYGELGNMAKNELGG